MYFGFHVCYQIEREVNKNWLCCKIFSSCGIKEGTSNDYYL